MSGLVNLNSSPVMRLPDKSCLGDHYDGDSYIATPVLLPLYFGQGQEDFIYSTPWWPNYGGLMNDGGLGDIVESAEFESYWTLSGCNGRLGFVGVTRDQYGSPVAGCTVRCYLVSTNELVSMVTSDANGAFVATSPYNTPHFLVTHGVGIAGASIDTLTPA